MEKRNDEFEDIEEHDEVQDDIEMGLDKEGTYYRKWKQLELRRVIVKLYVHFVFVCLKDQK